MRTRFFEATQAREGGANWGKFCVGVFDDEEWERRSEVGHAGRPLLPQLGWARDHVHLWVLDMQTGEGAYFQHGGVATYDLNSKHAIWVCPMFEPFLVWLYQQDVSDLDALPQVVELPDAEFSFSGYRRKGKREAQ